MRLDHENVFATALLSLMAILGLSMHAGAAKVPSSGRCEQIQVPMCKGLVGYNATRLPNKFGHRTQAEVYWALQPWWPFMDAGCSNNLRNFLCGLYLPRCIAGDPEPQYPCAETCKKAKVRCRRQMRIQKMPWSFRCGELLPKSSRKCIRPERERKKRHYRHYVLCEINRLAMCQDIPFSQGSLPNMFLQGDMNVIDREMQQFQPLLDSGCSNKLRFFLCGAYMPFCVPGTSERGGVGRRAATQAVVHAQPDVPFVVPCRELCQEVHDQCSGEYEQRTHGLPWPGKFHCHRYPSYSDRYQNNSNNNSSSGSRGRRVGTSIPCTMPPYNYGN